MIIIYILLYIEIFNKNSFLLRLDRLYQAHHSVVSYHNSAVFFLSVNLVVIASGIGQKRNKKLYIFCITFREEWPQNLSVL
jgi:hypothetical protein